MTPAALRDLLIAWAEINSGSENIAGLERMRVTLGQEFAKLPGSTVEHVTLERRASVLQTPQIMSDVSRGVCKQTPYAGQSGSETKALRVRVRPSAPQQILFSGHYDTVYGTDNPFQRCTLLNETTLRGPGVTDMKGGLVVILAALQEFERTADKARVGYEVLLTPDEETGSFASRPVLEAAARSGRFALGLVFEPARPNGDLVHSRKGTGNFVATAHGRAAHAASPIRFGRNAIAALAEFLVGAQRIPDELPGVLLNIGSIRGGGPATNVVPDFAEALLDVRTTRAGDRAPLLARLHELAAPINARDGFRLEISGDFNRPPKECVPREEAAFKAWQDCGRALGLPPFSWVHTGGASDGNFLSAAGLPNLDGLGPIGDRLHSADEFVHLPSLAERARLTACFLQKLASGAVALPAS